MRYVNFLNIAYGVFCLAVLAALLKLAVPGIAEPLNLASKTGNMTGETTAEVSTEPSGEKPGPEKSVSPQTIEGSENFVGTTEERTIAERTTAERTTAERTTAERTVTERTAKKPSSVHRPAMVPIGESARSAPVVDEATSAEETAAEQRETPRKPSEGSLRKERESAVRSTVGRAVRISKERRSPALVGFEKFEKEASAVRVEPPVFYRPSVGRSPGGSRGMPSDSGAQCADLSDVPGDRRAIFPLPADYANSYDDTWGAPRVQGGHEGTDLMSPSGTPEYAITDGTLVPVAGANSRGWNSLGGYTVMLRADYDVGPIRKGDLFYYAHMNEKESLPLGTRVRAGQRIGVAGDTGQGPEITRGLFPSHLHLGWYDTSGARTNLPSGAMNPYPLLEWLKSNGGVVSGGTDTRYCEAPQKPAPTPSTGDRDWRLPSSPGITPDLKTGTGKPRPSPVVSSRTPATDSRAENPRPGNPRPGDTRSAERPTALRNPNISRSVTGELQRPSPQNPGARRPEAGATRAPKNGDQSPNQQTGERRPGKDPENRAADRTADRPQTPVNQNGLKPGPARSAPARPKEQKGAAEKPGPDRERTVTVDNSPVTDEVRDAAERRNQEPEEQKLEQQRPQSTGPSGKRSPARGDGEKTSEHRAGGRTSDRDPENPPAAGGSTKEETLGDTSANESRNGKTARGTMRSDDQYRHAEKPETSRTEADKARETTGPDDR